MSKFYGKVIGQSRTEATRRGSAKSGITTYAASWAGAIHVTLYVDKEGNERCLIEQIAWMGHGRHKPIYDGKFPIE